MMFKYMLLSWCLFGLSVCDKSFTIVLDTTKSMQDELEIIKNNLPTAFETVRKDIGNYILVSFNDPDVEDPIVSQNPNDLMTAVNRITAEGGHKCPENSLSGIEKALQTSKPQSNIFVFTDAYPKDADKLEDVKNLCHSTGSQVVIFLTGFCLPSLTTPTATAQVYYDVAKACSGTVFNLVDTRDLRQMFKYIKEVVNVEWTDIISYDAFTDYREISFPVDSFTKTVLLSVSSKGHPTVVISPDLNSTSVFGNIVATKHTQVISLLQASPGEYRVTIRSNDTTSVILYKQSRLPIHIGFSTERPRSIKETSRRPLSGRNSYIIIEVIASIKIETIEIEVFGAGEKNMLSIEENVTEDIYLTKTFIEPDRNFRLWINGYDKTTTEKISGSSETLSPQDTKDIDTRWITPQAKILDDSPLSLELGSKTRLACKVVGYPKPSVWWEDGFGSELTAPSDGILLEIPSLYISYLHIENITTNATIYCKCKNSEGEHAQSINLYVYRPHTFEVIQMPQDLTIEYGGEGKLYCQVNAYPEAEIRWYHNNTVVSTSDDVEIVPEEYALAIKRMSLSDVGDYMCEAISGDTSKTYMADLTISGLEAPQVEIDNPDIMLQAGNWTYIECRIIKGKPSPEVRWEFKPKDGEDFSALPEIVVVEEDKVKIASAESGHNGVYRCHAENIEGHHSADVTVTVQNPPRISNSDTSAVFVKEGDDVALPCDVTGSPPPTVHWEVSQDDVLLRFDQRHYTDENYTHRFRALWKDSGNYHCIATNDIGTAEKTVTVNVLVKPYIEPPKLKQVPARAGSAVTLECNVSFGNPVPSTKWEFIARDSTTTTLKRSNTSSELHINYVRYADEGSYMCIAENNVGRDSIEMYLKVQ